MTQQTGAAKFSIKELLSLSSVERGEWIRAQNRETLMEILKEIVKSEPDIFMKSFSEMIVSRNFATR